MMVECHETGTGSVNHVLRSWYYTRIVVLKACTAPPNRGLIGKQSQAFHPVALLTECVVSSATIGLQIVYHTCMTSMRLKQKVGQDWGAP